MNEADRKRKKDTIKRGGWCFNLYQVVVSQLL
jgi:hypothetical protein